MSEWKPKQKEQVFEEEFSDAEFMAKLTPSWSHTINQESIFCCKHNLLFLSNIAWLSVLTSIGLFLSGLWVKLAGGGLWNDKYKSLGVFVLVLFLGTIIVSITLILRMNSKNRFGWSLNIDN